MSELDLFVVRHAVDYERDAERWPVDAQRPLTPEGVKVFRRASKGLAAIVREPIEKVLSSPYVRAWCTAEILSEVAGWGEPRRLPALAADRDVEDAMRALAGVATRGRLAIVGHDPMLISLCGVLTGVAGIQLGKGAVARMAVREFAPGGATLRWLLAPKVLRHLAD